MIIGQSLFATGLMIKSYPVALLGRAIFGLGGENLNVNINYFIMSWFSGKDIAMAMGISFTFARLASVLNDVLSPVIVVYSSSISLALWIGAMVCFGSFISAIILNQIDKGKTDSFKNNQIHQKLRLSDLNDLSVCYWIVCFNLGCMYISIFFLTTLLVPTFKKDLAIV